jgi:hypothetical protein
MTTLTFHRSIETDAVPAIGVRMRRPIVGGGGTMTTTISHDGGHANGTTMTADHGIVVGIGARFVITSESPFTGRRCPVPAGFCSSSCFLFAFLFAGFRSWSMGAKSGRGYVYTAASRSVSDRRSGGRVFILERVLAAPG